MHPRDDWFERVRPVIGQGLADKAIRARTVSLTWRVVDLLAGSLLGRVVVDDVHEPVRWPLSSILRTVTGDTAVLRLAAHLEWRNEFEPLNLRTSGKTDATLDGRWLPPGSPARAVWNRAERSVTLEVPPGDLLGFEDLSLHVARELRDVLLGSTEFPEKTDTFGNEPWPFSPCPRPLPLITNGSEKLGHVMVLGCGSVGSVFTRLLAERIERWTLIDPGRVTAYNPSRQWFGTEEIGQLKVDALSARLHRARAVARPIDRGTVPELGTLIHDDRPDLVLLATGTSDDGAIARLLWDERVPHVVAYAYPRARFFEVTTVMPGEGTPCLHCFRGHLFSGPESAPPIDDELAHFLYSPIPSELREQTYVNLVAEPATEVETARIAAVAARCATEALRSSGLRSGWFERMLHEGTTCLLGGNVAENGPDGWAYGIAFAGQVIRLGLPDLVGLEASLLCRGCGREHRVERVRGEEWGELASPKGLR